MKKPKTILGVMLLVNGLLLSQASLADLPVIDPAAIFQLKKQLDELGKLKDLHTQSIQQLSQQYGAITGNYGLGNLGYKTDLQSWGKGTERWQSVLQVYQQGGNPGSLSDVAKQLQQQFPIHPSHVANPNPNSMDAKFYELQAKTALTSRAASQMDYDNVQKQMDYMQHLHKEIDKTQNIKSAMDLQNRLLLENNKIQLELLRASALQNQQQAIHAQGEANTAINTFNAAK